MKHILIPTDFSANAQHAAIFGVQIAVAQQAKITFFHLSNFAGSINAAPTGDYSAEIKDNIEENKLKLQNFSKAVYKELAITSSQIPTEHVVIEGFAFADQVAVYAEKHHVDMIILGTRGQTGIKSVLFGSNTSTLIGKSPCSVLAIPENCKYDQIKYIAFATTLENTEKAVDGLIDYVKLFNASLQLFYIYPSFPANINVETFDNHALVEGLSKKFDYHNISLYFEHTSKENDVQIGINQFVRAYKPSMLAIYTHERTWLDKLLNASITESIALQTELPLLALRA
jgi:nucleotide-binding universal stress UspA family protein